MADFQSGLFSCVSDVGFCVYTAFCTPCAMATNWSKVRGEKCGVEHCCCFANEYWTRQFIRSRKHMSKNSCADCMACMFCGPCVICQDNKELNAGFGCPPPSEYFAGQQNDTMQQGLVQNPEYNPQQLQVQGYPAPTPGPIPTPYGEGIMTQDRK